MERRLFNLKTAELLKLSHEEFVDCIKEVYFLNYDLSYGERAGDAQRTMTCMKVYLFQKRFPSSSPMGTLGQLLRGFEIEGEGDVFDFIYDASEYLESLEDIDDEGKWKMTDNLSPNLLKLFGKAAASDLPSVDDWRAPIVHGLGNSKRLMDTNLVLGDKKLTIDELFALSTSDFINAARETFSLNNLNTNPDQRIYENTVTFLSVKSYILNHASKNANSVFSHMAEYLREIDDEKLDEDDIFDYMDALGDYFDDLEDLIDDLNMPNDEQYTIQNNMSSNLMALFGKSNGPALEAVDETNPFSSKPWVAPSAAGLENSRPIVKIKQGATNLFDSYEVIDFDDFVEPQDEDGADDDEDYDEVQFYHHSLYANMIL